MEYRCLGKTGLQVSEIGFGGEWLERHEADESVALVKYAHSRGINIIDCWMPDPKSRDIIGRAIAEDRAGWVVQGHIGSTYQNGQYTRTRDAEQCRIAFEDLLSRLKTDYIDLGMIHYVDREDDWDAVSRPGPYLDYVMELKSLGKIRHIGLSTHNPVIAVRAAESGWVEMILFSVNPAFDLMPPTDNIENYFADTYAEGLNGVDPVRARMYRICEQHHVGITCMKPYAGGRLFDAKRSPFGVALTPVQCIHYALTKPGVASVLCGYDLRDCGDGEVIGLQLCRVTVHLDLTLGGTCNGHLTHTGDTGKRGCYFVVQDLVQGAHALVCGSRHHHDGHVVHAELEQIRKRSAVWKLL